MKRELLGVVLGFGLTVQLTVRVDEGGAQALGPDRSAEDEPGSRPEGEDVARRLEEPKAGVARSNAEVLAVAAEDVVIDVKLFAELRARHVAVPHLASVEPESPGGLHAYKLFHRCSIPV